MNIKDFCVTKKQTLKAVMKVIDVAGFGIAIIVEKQKLLGIITDSDIRRALLEGITLETPVEQVMNKEPIKITSKELEDQSFSVEQFPLYGITQVPVVDKNNNIKDILMISKKEIVGQLTDGKQKPVKRILVVGGAGYLGSVLCPYLLSKGYTVCILDNLTYGDAGIKNIYHYKNFEFTYGDMRDMKTVMRAIKDVDAVIYLAAIVGDPACDLDPEETIKSNYLATKLFAEVCKYSQINRFIFASTCSVYGAAEPGKMLTETSKLNPVSLYAQMKLKSEHGLLELEDDNFSPTILRMGTLFGSSPRMRFDLVVNILTIKALKEHQFKIFGGNQWRALCSVDDASDAYIRCLESPIKEVKGQVFNISTSNMQIKQIGDIVHKILPDAQMIIEKDKEDARNYCVSSDKAQRILDFEGLDEVEDAVIDIKLKVKNTNAFEDYLNKKYSNVAFLRKC